MIDLKIDQAQFDKVKKLLADMPNGIKEALRQTISKTLTKTRTEIINREVVAIGVTKKYIEREVKVKRAETSGMISVIGRRIPLIAFRATQGAVGATFEAGGTGLIPSAFEARMPGGHTGIFKRYTPGWSGQRTMGAEYGGQVSEVLLQRTLRRNRRFQEVYGPSPGAILENAPGMLEGVKQSAGEMLQKTLDITAEKLVLDGNIKRDIGA